MSDSPFNAGAPRVSRTLAAVALLVLAGAASWYFTRRPPTEPMPEGHDHGSGGSEARAEVTLDSATARRIGVTYATVERGTLPRVVRVPAKVVVDETRQSVIAPKVEGWVETLSVQATGLAVRAGDPLFALYSPMLVAAQEELVLAARLAAAEEARGETDGTAADLVRSARRRLAYWDVPSEEIERIVRSGVTSRTLTLRAPRDGVVLAKNVVVGQRIMEGEVAFAVAALDTVWVEGEVFERDLAAVRAGEGAEVEALAWPGEVRRGTINFIAPTVTEATRTVRVRLALPNADRRFKPGMLATLSLRAGAARATLHVPRSAVLATGTRALVFVQRADGVLEPREVRLGAATDERQEILSGVSVGERVVQSATFLVDAESNLRAALGMMAPTSPATGTTPAAAPAPAAHQH